MLILSRNFRAIRPMALPAQLRNFSQENEHEKAQKIPEIKACLYETLGVPKDAGPQDIKVAYLSKAREYHPDKRPECLEYFTHVTNAYDTLADPHKRAIYDDESIPDEDYFTVYVGS